MTKIAKALEDSNGLMKGVTKALKNDIKKEVLCLYYQCYLVLWVHLYSLEEECTELVIKDKDYLEQGKEFKKYH